MPHHFVQKMISTKTQLIWFIALTMVACDIVLYSLSYRRIASAWEKKPKQLDQLEQVQKANTAEMQCQQLCAGHNCYSYIYAFPYCNRHPFNTPTTTTTTTTLHMIGGSAGPNDYMVKEFSQYEQLVEIVQLASQPIPERPDGIVCVAKFTSASRLECRSTKLLCG